TVSVFKNTSTAVGTISYAAKQDYTTGVTTPLSVAIGDLDGDGKADLAVANYGSNTVSIFRNTSTAVGTMSYASGQKTGSGPISIAIGDLDGDGKVDLAVINESSATVSVFRNTSTAVGTISYAAKQDYTTGTEPYSAAIGDLDGDGKADLAVANASSYTVSVFRNLNGIEESIIGTLQNQIVQLSGGSGTDQRNYSIISFPFKNPSVNTLLEELGPYDNSQWRLFRYNGSNREYSVNFGNINSGEGYWFIQRESNNIEMGGESVDITEGSYKMDLVSGFNLIGNPFVWTLNWGEVIDYNVEKGTISLDDFESDYQTSVYAWRTSWRLSSNLEKFEGGFIKTTRAISNFEIPLSALNNAGGRIANELPQKKDIDIDDERWKLNFHIYSPSYDYHLGGIGLSPSASDQKDIWDGSTLPRFIEYLEVDFGDGITRSMKHLDENKSWSFKLPNNLNESSIHLTWDQPISSVNTIILVDSKSRHIFDLSSSRGINISNDPSIVYYLYFGKKESILDQLNLPFDVMHEIYPNPTENKLNIRLYASDHKVGTLKMIGMDGKEILNYSINLEKGMNNHQIRLEELQIPEGIYYLNINNRISTKLIKK
ncbi:MAG: FG-GAP-like repeat-containing protein, partial [Cyclobacteriaceae bacterium]